jgi:hypothetical protein
MNTFLSFLPIVIAGVFVLLGGILIIDHEKKLELRTSDSERSPKK